MFFRVSSGSGGNRKLKSCNEAEKLLKALCRREAERPGDVGHGAVGVDKKHLGDAQLTQLRKFTERPTR